MADRPASATSTPLPQQLAGASMTVGGIPASLIYADAGQIVGLIPADIPVNGQPQLVVLHGNQVGLPSSIIIASTHPSMLTKDGSGRGQGLIYKASGSTRTLADASNPVKAGDTVVIYCAGLGLNGSNGTLSNPPSVSIGGQQAPINYAGVSLAQDYPSGGAPTLLGGLAPGGFGGLYQITATVPSGLTGGPAAVIVSSAGQSSQQGVTLMIGGTVAGPQISSGGIVNAASFQPSVAPGSLASIFGVNFISPAVGAESVPLPMKLGGVSVTIGGRPAPMLYADLNQINFQVPYETAVGTASVIATVNGVDSAPAQVTVADGAPGIFVYSQTFSVVQNQDYSLNGPANPAKVGSFVTLYATGLGAVSPSVATGAAAPGSPLSPANLRVTALINNVQAAVPFAGLSPGFVGLYQVNIQIPDLPTGTYPVKITAGSAVSNAPTISVSR